MSTVSPARLWAAASVLATALIVPVLPVAAQGTFGAGYGPPLQVQPPAKTFATSDEHYAWLLAQAHGGTQHTLTSVPRWDGLWEAAGNTHMDSFITTGNFQGKVKPGVLTPAYEKAYKERWRQQQEEGQVRYDRLTSCEPAGMPRWLLEPYTHEFVNLPDQSYFINDFANSIRRVHIGQQHSNLTGTHSWLGDTVGFWDGDKLVMHTKYLLPADFTRWSPMTSNQFESVEIWQLKHYPGGIDRLEVQATFYDSFAFVKPVNAVYAFKHASELEKAGYRVQYWECETSSNAYLDDKGMTNFHLPGEPGYKDARGETLFPELPGQSRDPIYNTKLTTEKE
ncbi:MAG TPA: hypothetical protein VMH83_03385 [Candidatus Acidoferrum sp.]|nr:hypothetical protein [Candidatus Acidoferrum sp.]